MTEQEEKLVCKICGFKAKHPMSLSLHVVKEHKLKSKEYYDKYLKKAQEGICFTCGKETKFWNINKGYRKHCSRECTDNSQYVRDKRANTNLERYGVINVYQNEDIKNKIKETCLKKFGVPYSFQSENNKEKSKKTCLERYGVENPSRIKEIQEKRIETNRKKLGVDWPMQSNEIKNKSKETCLNKYGVEYSLQSENNKTKASQTCLAKYGKKHNGEVSEFHEKASVNKRTKFYEALFTSMRLEGKVEPLFSLEEYIKLNGVCGEYRFKCNQCGNEFVGNMNDGNLPRCPTCFPRLNGKSQYEEEISEYLKSIGLFNIKQKDRSVIRSNETGFPLELDIFLPDFMLAIEFNGIYYHNIEKTDKAYHKIKLDLCSKKGISLFTIWEDLWNNHTKKEIYKSMLLNKVGKIKTRIYARECSLIEINENEYHLFLEKNHIQGYTSAKIKLGLFYKDELVSVMSFGKPRFNKKYEYEMVRFCNKVFTNVVGGAEKLFTYFIKTYSPLKIISYSSNDNFSGKIYPKLNFSFINESDLNYFYVKNGTPRLSRLHCQKHKLKTFLKYYNEELSEYENMRLNGYFKIYDSGNKVFSWKGEV